MNQLTHKVMMLISSVTITSATSGYDYRLPNKEAIQAACDVLQLVPFQTNRNQAVAQLRSQVDPIVEGIVYYANNNNLSESFSNPDDAQLLREITSSVVKQYHQLANALISARDQNKNQPAADTLNTVYDGLTTALELLSNLKPVDKPSPYFSWRYLQSWVPYSRRPTLQETQFFIDTLQLFTRNLLQTIRSFNPEQFASRRQTPKNTPARDRNSSIKQAPQPIPTSPKIPARHPSTASTHARPEQQPFMPSLPRMSQRPKQDEYGKTDIISNLKNQYAEILQVPDFNEKKVLLEEIFDRQDYLDVMRNNAQLYAMYKGLLSNLRKEHESSAFYVSIIEELTAKLH